MTTWVLTTLEKKNVVETEFWTKDGNTIKRSTGFRWGTVYCESDERPDIDLDNPDGLEVFATDYDFELDNLDDGCCNMFTFKSCARINPRSTQSL